MLLKHICNTTAAIEVLKRFYVKEKDVWKLKVRWYSIGSKRPPRDMGFEQKFTVPARKMKDWKVYTTQGVKRD